MRFLNAIGATYVLSDKIVISKQVFVAFRKEKKVSFTGNGRKCLICLDHVRAEVLNLQFCRNTRIKLLLKSVTLKPKKVK